MGIIWVELKGFKAYSETTRVVLHGQVNCIVGSNGSGKSTIVDAIRLIVDDAALPRKQSAAAILHKGVRNQAVIGHVEIALATDAEATEANALRLRRVFSLAKTGDAYLIDGKKVTKNQFVARLVAAGFAFGKPHYIIGQGKVMEMALASEEARLKALKDLSGINVFDKERDEAVEELSLLRAKIDALDFSLIKERIAHLETQRDQLRVKDECIATIAAIDLLLNLLKLFGTADLPEDPENDTAGTNGTGLEIKAIALTRQTPFFGEIQSRIDALEQQLRSFAVESDVLVDEEVNMAEHKRLMQELEHEIAVARTKLKTVSQQEYEKKQLLVELEANYNRLNISHKLLSRLEANAQELATKKERLWQELADATGHQADCEERLRHLSPTDDESQLARDVEETERAIATWQQRVAEIEERQRALTAARAAVEQAVSPDKIQVDLDATKGALSEIKKALQSLEVETLTERGPSEHALEKECEALERLYRPAVRKAYGAIMRKHGLTPGTFIKNVFEAYLGSGLPSIMGPLWFLIQPKAPEFATCVHAALGRNIDSLVVRDDGVIADVNAILKATNMNVSLTLIPFIQMEEKFGSFRFDEALDRSLEIGRSLETHNCVRLIDCLRLEDLGVLPCARLRTLLLQVTSRYVVVRDTNLKREYREKLLRHYDCVSLDGVVLAKNGTVSGGHRAASRNMVIAAQRINDCLREQHRVAVARARRSDLEAQACRQQDALNELLARYREASDRALRLQELQANLGNVGQQLAEATKALARCQDRLSSMKSVAKGKPHTADEATLAKLRTELADLSRTAADRKQQLQDVENSIESHLHQIRGLSAMRPEFVETEQKYQALASECDGLQVISATLKNTVAELTQKLDAHAGELHGIEEQVAAKQHHRATLQQQHKFVSFQIEAEREKLTQLKGEVKKVLEQRTSVLQGPQSRTLYEKLVADFVTSAHAVDQAIGRLEEHKARLVAENDALGQMNHRAIHDLESFVNECKANEERRNTLLDSVGKLEALIKSLNERRSQILTAAFSQVNDGLKNIFQQVVPTGYAELKPLFQDTEMVGLQLRASFQAAVEPLPLVSLSGGQKTVLALCLIMSMQQYEPAPVCVLDEVDAALDQNYRGNIASLLRQTGEQYVVTTFRPEFVNAADQHFLVTNQDRVAHVRPCTKAEALAVVTADDADL